MSNFSMDDILDSLNPEEKAKLRKMMGGKDPNLNQDDPLIKAAKAFEELAQKCKPRKKK